MTRMNANSIMAGRRCCTAGATVAQASPPAGCGSVSLPVQGRATTRGGTPLEPAAGTAALPVLPVALTAVAPKRRYVASRKRKVRPISDLGNGNESIHRRIGMNPSFVIHPSASALRKPASVSPSSKEHLPET